MSNQLERQKAKQDQLIKMADVRSNLNIYVSNQVARHYRITDWMVEDFVRDPVMGAQVLFGEHLDVFQRVRLKMFWHVPRVMDSSGFSSAKTRTMWVVANLRALLIQEQIGAVYYQDFGAGQRNFWTPNYRSVAKNSAIFRAHLGRMEADNSKQSGKHELKGPSCWSCDYKNGSQILMPAPGFLQDAKSQAGLRINDLFIDEWTKIVATGSTGIEDQLIGRATRACFNKNHPFWCNHQIFLATAEDSGHPAWSKYMMFKEEIERGNPDYSLVSFSYKDYSDLEYKKTGTTFKDKYREDKVINDLKKSKSASGFRQEGLGIWSKMGKTLYPADTIDNSHKIGEINGVRPLIGRNEDWHRRQEQVHYFLGADPAKADNKKADDGALVALRACPKPDTRQPYASPAQFDLDFVWAYKVRRADGPQWSGIIHRVDQRFNFSRICMDPGGGGNWIRPELKKVKQVIQGVETDVVPIACIEDEAELPVLGKFSLMMFRIAEPRIKSMWGHMMMHGGDNLYDSAHTEFIEAWSRGIFRMPPKSKDVPRQAFNSWSEERKWSNHLLYEVGRQLKNIVVQVNSDGTTFLTKNNARVFSASRGRKDFAYAAMFAYVAFLSWLKDAENDPVRDDDDGDMCG